MSKPSTFARVALAAAAGVMTLSTAVAAQAQPYGSSSYSGYSSAGGNRAAR